LIVALFLESEVPAVVVPEEVVVFDGCTTVADGFVPLFVLPVDPVVPVEGPDAVDVPEELLLLFCAGAVVSTSSGFVAMIVAPLSGFSEDEFEVVGVGGQAAVVV
jgi:hypothetical protein